MSDYMTLMGAEDVSRAGYNMKSAAESMNHAASSMSHTLEMHQRFMDDWLQRLSSILTSQDTDK